MNEKNIPVKGHPNLERDPQSTAILNSDTDAFKKAKLRSRNTKKREERLSKVESEVVQLNNKMDEIISLLKEKK